MQIIQFVEVCSTGYIIFSPYFYININLPKYSQMTCSPDAIMVKEMFINGIQKGQRGTAKKARLIWEPEDGLIHFAVVNTQCCITVSF